MPSSHSYYAKHHAIVFLIIIVAWSGKNHDIITEAFAPTPISRSVEHIRHHRNVAYLISTSSIALEAAASTTEATSVEGGPAVEERPHTDESSEKTLQSNIDSDSDNDNAQVGDDTISTILSISTDEAKEQLLQLIPRMTGTDEEYREVESYINLLEEKYSPVQTIDFLNLAMMGEWQLLFSTNLLGSGFSRRLRLREMVQKIETNGFNGTLINMATWDFAEGDDDDNDDFTFNINGNFNIKCSYTITQGSRMVVDVNDLEVRPASGSSIPKDVPNLVGTLHRVIPNELFDPNGHAMDTTYIDTDIRIIRFTGPNHEGVRNIFMRKGALEISSPM